ncbi:MAG: DNA-directed RNA polymerase subunit K [Candidatus Aenigmatarchaeota archaeon]|nr:DNA-directed RNA polymerase subunit K [Candidatus Aenigmarchaeota archaeon]
MSEKKIVIENKDEYTRFEKTRIIGARAHQIAAGAPIFIKTNETDPIKIAQAEFEAGVIPIVVRRKLPAKKE